MNPTRAQLITLLNDKSTNTVWANADLAEKLINSQLTYYFKSKTGAKRLTNWVRNGGTATLEQEFTVTPGLLQSLGLDSAMESLGRVYQKATGPDVWTPAGMKFVIVLKRSTALGIKGHDAGFFVWSSYPLS